MFFLSLDDDLMRIFGSERLEKVLNTLGMKEGEAIVHPWVNKSLERAQAKVEGRNFDTRKQLLKFDDVMNDQRKAVFEQRLEIMDAEDIGEIAEDMRQQVIDDLVDTHLPPKSYADQWDVDGLSEAVTETLNVEVPISAWAEEDGVDQEVVRERLYAASAALMAGKQEAFGDEQMRQIEKQFLLQTIDAKWREHLMTLEHLRSVVGFRGYAQRDPLNEYKTEGFQLFETMLDSLRVEVTKKLSKVRPLSEAERAQMMQQMIAQQRAAAGPADAGAREAAASAAAQPDGRGAGSDARFRGERSDDLGQARSQRPLPLRLGQEVQALPRGVLSEDRRSGTGRQAPPSPCR